MELPLSLLAILVAFLLARMLLKGATAGGVTRRDKPVAYWGIVVAQSTFIAFLIYVVLRESG